jgi:uncharacterized membrane protein
MKEFGKREQKGSQLKKNFLYKKIGYLESFPILIIIVTIIFDLTYFPRLPSQVPVHYNINGIADNWGSKSIIFTLPGIMIFIYLFLFLINRLLILRKHPRLYSSLYFVYTALLIVFGAIDFGTVFIAFGKLKSLIAILLVPLILNFMSILNLLISVLWAVKREQKLIKFHEGN